MWCQISQNSQPHLVRQQYIAGLVFLNLREFREVDLHKLDIETFPCVYGDEFGGVRFVVAKGVLGVGGGAIKVGSVAVIYL